MSLGRNIMKARTAKGLTVAQLAKLLDVSRSTVHTWEHDGPGPGLERLKKLASQLGTSMGELLGERGVAS